ncbi:NACHT domain-containing protein [Butyrivibrio sp. XPD2002]|uniref:NACHT domain-containing protein n=1 Tax=Butyrivibrio sp. XPD2002 TaxID=1280665 RepID=UPI0003FDF024|nr:NACHT domain-containing protein [Butyrivibrio sp. XPD2002]
MGGAVSNVVCSVLAAIIYDICKVCVGKINGINNSHNRKSSEEIVKEKLGDNYEILYMSSEFHDFLKTPFFKDTIENYIIYKITGNCNSNLGMVKRNNSIIVEKDIIEFLLSNLFDNYYSGAVTRPESSLVRTFFEHYFKVAADFVAANMNEENKLNVFFINRRIDYAQEQILLRFEETVETIKRTINCEIIPVNKKYEDNVKEYHRLLKANHSQAHIYLLDTFDFAEFYVPPMLRLISPGHEIKSNLKVLRHDLLYIHEEETIGGKVYFDDWKHIFDENGIVYVTGGAGYGKSLFLQKLINDFCEINILNSSEYLVIYGDLKSFYVEGDQPIPVVKFLQDSMVKETLVSEKKFSIDMIEYYIKMGRCLILLDALDEVEKQKREKLHKLIISYFKNQNPNNKICITSRNRGFIPEKEVETFDIMPLDRKQIETYVDNIINLGRFDIKDKETFLRQSNVLVEKGFLNSFLVLSLLINIYKAERELPENKMELYQKCFDYIAYKREKEKTKAKYNWDLISCMMKDNTFMELAKMCFPNNSAIGKKEIVDMLCDTYRGKYISEAETERAAEDFLSFCSDRTELFVPAAGEDRFKFFHRSFFEYFYSQYIFMRLRNVEEVYNSLQQFDVDSEVYELTLAMMKQKDEPRYQELVEYIFERVNIEVEGKGTDLNAFNILTLGMQTIDDNIYMHKYIEFLISNKEKIVKNIGKIPNQHIIYNVISSNKNYAKQVYRSYENIAKFTIIKYFLEQFPDVEKMIWRKWSLDISDEKRKQYIKHRFYTGYGNTFFMNVYIENVDYSNIIQELSKKKLEKLMGQIKVHNKTREKCLRLFEQYTILDVKKQRVLQEILLSNPTKG